MTDGRQATLEKGVYMRSNGTLVIDIDTADQTNRNGIGLIEVGGPRALTITRGAFQRIHREYEQTQRCGTLALILRSARRRHRKAGDSDVAIGRAGRA